MAKLPSDDGKPFVDPSPADSRHFGDDDMVSGMSGFGNELPAQDDKDAADEERIAFTRLAPALEFLNNVVDEQVDQITDIRSLVVGNPDQQPDKDKVMIELRARELHLDFLEKFRARIQNVQNTIEEIRTNG